MAPLAQVLLEEVGALGDSVDVRIDRSGKEWALQLELNKVLEKEHPE